MSILTKKERDEFRYNLDAPRWKCVNCGLLERGHMTSAAQGGRSCPDCGLRHYWTGAFPESAPHDWSARESLRQALDTIDALEAERDALKTDLHLWRKTSSSLHAQVNWMAGMIGRIKFIADLRLELIDAMEAERDAIRGIARVSHYTRTIRGSHAALREILAVIEGGESDDSIRRVTCKCINGGETTINWRTGCGETLCHAELIDDEEGDR